MSTMRSLTLLSILAPIISAHTRFSALFVNSQSRGDGTCIRMDMDPSTTTHPITSVSSANMACGVEGNIPVNRTCAVRPGDSITLLHRNYPDGSQPGSIDPRHKGSTAVYMKKLASTSSTDPYSSLASGDGWFKIAWNGYDENDKQWGTEKLVASQGNVEATIPSGLAGGYYLIRSEIMSLHNVTENKVYPQFFVGCVQAHVEGPESGDESAVKVSIPGYVDSSTPALNYNIYSDTPPAVSFEEFGPEVYGTRGIRLVRHVAIHPPWKELNGLKCPMYNNSMDGWSKLNSATDSRINDTAIATDTGANVTTVGTASTTSLLSERNIQNVSSSRGTSSCATDLVSKSAMTPRSTDAPSYSNSTSAFIGTCPLNTVLTVGNQCLIEIPSWSSDTSGALPQCWAASRQCWGTSQTCWVNISPAVNTTDMNAGCHAWEAKCNGLDRWCNDGNTKGPPVWNGGNVGLSKRDKE